MTGMWLVYSILAALSESVKDALGKKTSQDVDEYVSAFSLHVLTLILCVPFLFFEGVPQLSLQFWQGSAVFVIITPLWSILYMKALKWSPLSVVAPMLGFVPIFTALLGLIFGESISAVGWMGVLLISIGIYAVYVKSDQRRTDFMAPIRRIGAEKGAMAMLGVAVLWSMGAHLSKMRVDGSSALFSTLTGALIGVVTTFIIAKWRSRVFSAQKVRQHFWQLGPLGIGYFLASYFSSLALVTGAASYVFTAKRSSIAFTTLLGTVFYKERVSVIGFAGIFLTLAGIFCLAI